jgi:membrane protein YqaA with SNARE-associated domain
LIATLGALFLAAFVAASLLPAQSEGLLAYYIITSDLHWAALIAVATLGNVLGSLLNYAFGLGLSSVKSFEWLRPKEEQMLRARNFYQRYGRWSLLLSWVPVIGDPLTFIAGVMREKLWRFLWIVTLAKSLRYLAVAYFASYYVS